MSEWSLQDWLTFIAASGAAALAFYTGVVRPTLAQIKELIVALKDNTASTDVSARAQTSNAAATAENTEATRVVAKALPASPVTVNVGQSDDQPAGPPV